MRKRNRTSSFPLYNGTRARLLSIPQELIDTSPIAEINALTGTIRDSTWSSGTTSSGSVGVLGANKILGYQQGALPRQDWAEDGTTVSGYSYNESSITNYLRLTNTLGTGWLLSGLTVQSGTVTGPDGTASAKRITNSATPATLTYSRGAIGAGTKRFTVWLRRNAGSGTVEIAANTAAYSTVTVTSEWQRFQVIASAALVVGIRLNGSTGQEIDVYAPTAVLNQYHRGPEIINPTTSDLSRAADVVTVANSLISSSKFEGTAVLEGCVSRFSTPELSEAPYLLFSKTGVGSEQVSLSVSFDDEYTSCGVSVYDGDENEIGNEFQNDLSAPKTSRVALSWNATTMSWALNGGNAVVTNISGSPAFQNYSWYFSGIGAAIRYAAVYDKSVNPSSVSFLSRRMS